MIISLNWLKRYTAIDRSVDDLATLIGARLVEIESVEALTEKYKDVIIAKVMECRDVEDSDHLHVTKIDDGGVVSGVERDENGFIQVVCGAPNVRQDLMVAWLPPRSVVPETYGTAEPFTLESRKLRGYVSNGMLASARELDLFDEHEGILEIDEAVQPGSLFAEVYELNDVLLDIENKSLTHRPDTFGVVGFAREVAGIQQQPFETPSFLLDLNPTIENDHSVSAPRVFIDDEGICGRYEAIILADASVGAVSPLKVQTYLSRSGLRPINAIVDVTNYLMLETGQPLHAFDYDKVCAIAGDNPEIHVRLAHEGEQLALLDGRTISLSGEDIVITAGDTPIALAGAMGGSATEIDSNTRRIILESATFDLYRLRSTQMRHGIFSEAITRFTKGQPAALTAPVLFEAVRLLGLYAEARPVSDVVDTYPHPVEPITISLSLDHINQVLGTSFDTSFIIQLLAPVGLEVSEEGDLLQIEIPYWRQDLHIPEDIIEEIGRLYGFDSVTPTLPRRSFKAVEPASLDQLRRHLRLLLKRAGANEVLNYSFIHGEIMKRVGQNTTEAYRLTNSISPELQYYRQSLVPSLLTTIHPNVKAGFDHFAVYEWNKVHTKQLLLTEENVPSERISLGFVVTDTKSQRPAYYEAKRTLDFIADELHVSLRYEAIETMGDEVYQQPFEPKRSAQVLIENGEGSAVLGIIGELKNSVIKNMKLPHATAAFEIFPQQLLKASSNESYYRASSRFPSVERDICFQINHDTQYQKLVDVVEQQLSITGLEAEIRPLDIYQPEGAVVKNITLRIRLQSFEKTLEGHEVADIITSVEAATRDTLEAKII